jgi:hypothetical protein
LIFYYASADYSPMCALKLQKENKYQENGRQ